MLLKKGYLDYVIQNLHQLHGSSIKNETYDQPQIVVRLSDDGFIDRRGQRLCIV